MNKKILLLLALPLFFGNCEDVDTACIADIAVTALDAPAAVISGNPIEIICVIKNVVNTIAECTDAGATTATVSCAYSPTFQDSFDKYVEYDSYTEDLATYKAGEGQEDLMQMETIFGPGFYAFKVTVDSENDTAASNNSRAVAIRAN